MRKPKPPCPTSPCPDHPAEEGDAADSFPWPLAPRKRLAPGARRELAAADLRKRYEHYTFIRELVELTGRSYGFVHHLLTEAGVTLRPRGGNQRPTKSRP